MHIYGCNIVTDEADLDIVILLMAVPKDRGEDRSMEFFNFRAPARTDAEYICKIGIFREHRCKSVRIVTVPCVHKPVHYISDRLLIGFFSGLAEGRH